MITLRLKGRITGIILAGLEELTLLALSRISVLLIWDNEEVADVEPAAEKGSLNDYPEEALEGCLFA